MKQIRPPVSAKGISTIVSLEFKVANIADCRIESYNMMSEVSSHCLTERQMQLAVNDIERLFIGKIVPVLIVFGISGNILNLTVLLTPAMRTRSNVLLACLAVADIVFLVFMFPHSLAHYKIFAFSYWFRRIYLGYKDAFAGHAQLGISSRSKHR
ncbi:hypothetical protein OSTOST_09004 [Ostertagia ostertagi]